MEQINRNINFQRVCQVCDEPLDEDAHGNKKMHDKCAYNRKKERQKENYQIGNEVKLMIQKNEKIAAALHNMDREKKGITHMYVLEQGFKFSCPVSKRDSLFGEIHMIDKYGYLFKDIKNNTLIIFYHESEIL